MRVSRSFVVLAFLVACGSAHAQELAAVCHATSSYDITIGSSQLLFDRPAPAPREVVLRAGTMHVDGQPVPLNDENQDRVDVFERGVRALEPRVKSIAEQGVDIAAETVHQQANTLNLSAETRAELEQRLATHAADLKQRIAASQSTHDWHGDAANEYANQVAEDIAPLIAADLGQQAVSAALNGDLQGAENLRDRASNLAAQMQPLLQRRLQALRPQVQALCPEIKRISDVQDGIYDTNGRPLNLLNVGQ